MEGGDDNQGRQFRGFQPSYDRNEGGGNNGGGFGGDNKYKTALCNNFQSEGFCKFGDNCKFAHGEADLKSGGGGGGGFGGQRGGGDRGGYQPRGRGGFGGDRGGYGGQRGGFGGDRGGFGGDRGGFGGGRGGFGGGGVCRFFQQHGSCKFGDDCKFTHEGGQGE